MELAIKVNDVRKSYGLFEAVKGISFNVVKGTCFGVLGPNGAGKTTLMGMMEGIVPITKGDINILEMDVKKSIHKIQPRVGIQLQNNNYFKFLTVGQLLKFYISLRRATKRQFNSTQLEPYSIDEILELLSLSDKSNVKIEELSGGQAQRFSIAVAMLEDPEIIFLDEPTSALDPQNRRYTWDFIEKIKEDKKKTIVLTTHFMEEAQTLCDDLIIMDHGKIILRGSPDELIRSLNKYQSVRFNLKNGELSDETLSSLVGVQKHFREKNRIIIHSINSINTLKSLFQCADENKVEISEFDVTLPNLEDVFISKTGVALRDS